MSSLLSSTLNTRAILPGSLRFVRSDVPYRITEPETDWLITKGITTVVDLREVCEQKQKPCPLAQDARFRYHSMPVTGGNAVPSSVDDVSKAYIRMADEQMCRIVDLIWSADTNVLYFCSAGKDRTGVVSAILLHRSGMDTPAIIDDYMKSKDNLAGMLEAYAKQSPDVDIRVITPHEEYMQAFMDWYTAQGENA
ncbi:MAG: tyrosine-protein phosphatase [Clostridiales bacterium]|nr:tyrosine-protein phosphatase [Clostridiales bacterium]